MRFPLFIARRYLFSAKDVRLINIITGISVAGVSLGVAALIVVLSVMNGFYDFVRDLLVSLDPHIRIERVEVGGFTEADSIIALAQALPSVTSAAAYVEGKALLLVDTEEQQSKVVIVRGIDADAMRGVSQVVDRLGLGTFDVSRKQGRPGIVVGRTLAQRLALVPETNGTEGAQVGLLSAPGIEQLYTQFFGTLPLSSFEVRGMYELDPTYDESHVFISIAEAQRLFRMPNRYSGVELRLASLDDADQVKAQLEAQLDPAVYRVRTWYDLQRSLYDVMRLEKWGASLILGLIIVVAAFNIVGALTMVVIQKRKDVGVLQAMGVSQAGIRRIFLTEGTLIGVLGTGFGLVLGLGLALAQQHFKLVPLAGAESFLISAYPVAIRVGDVAVVVVVAIVLCVLAAWYPAQRAASIEPAEAVVHDI